MSKEEFDALAYSLRRGQAVLAERAEAQRKDKGQFLTPAPIARYMARCLGGLREGAHVLDPAIGSGVLACAVIEHAVRDGRPHELSIHGYEPDGELYRAARESLATAAQWAATRGVAVHTCLEQKDFLFECTPGLTPPSLFSLNEPAGAPIAYDCIIANPPYFKLNTEDGHVKAVLGHLKGHTNIYTLFMALATHMLAQHAVACFIVPRQLLFGGLLLSISPGLRGAGEPPGHSPVRIKGGRLQEGLGPPRERHNHLPGPGRPGAAALSGGFCIKGLVRSGQPHRTPGRNAALLGEAQRRPVFQDPGR